jgi:Double-GTPase 2
MEDFFILLLGALAIVAYIACVCAFVVFVAPLVAAAAALYVAGDLAGGYFHRMHGVLARRTPEFELIPPYRPGTPENGPEPAFRQYFFGPAMRDLRQIIQLGWQRARYRVTSHAARFTAWTFTAPPVPVLFTWPAGVAAWVGLAAGTVVGGLLAAVVAALHAVMVLLAQAAARGCALALRGADTVALMARGVRGMRCPWCYERSKYPAYRCACDRLHHDIRPGRYGVFRRRCECDRRMPTLILLGSYRLNAYCTHTASCGQQMSDETGRFREVVLPLLGGRAAGKTRLMAAMLVALHEAAHHAARTDGAVGLRLANLETTAAYEVLSTVLDDKGYISGTRSDLPHAHSVLLRTGRRTRLVHIFDPAGERLVRRERADELRYLPAARTFLFVLDPLSVPAFWDSLSEQEKSTIDSVLASRVHPQQVFDQAIQQAIEMGATLRGARLAVAISKTDLIEHTRLLDGRTDDDGWARRWLTEELGLGNLVRAMGSEFGEVRFFFTAAVTVAPRQAHPSIAPLVSWTLGVPVRPGISAPAPSSPVSGALRVRRGPAGESLPRRSEDGADPGGLVRGPTRPRWRFRPTGSPPRVPVPPWISRRTVPGRGSCLPIRWPRARTRAPCCRPGRWPVPVPGRPATDTTATRCR